MAVPGSCWIALSYFSQEVGLSKFQRDSRTKYLRGGTECPGGGNLASPVSFVALLLGM